MSGEEAAVAEANARFYRAFETLDLTAMDAVTIFRNTTEMQFTISDLVVTLFGDLGWVTCAENILGQVGDRVSVTSVLATNLFERSADGWRMVHHHASHVCGAAEPA